MPSPCWQYWIDLGIKFLGTVATFLAIFVALFGAWLRNRLWPPSLTVSLARTEGDQSMIWARDQEGRLQFISNGFWYHARVENKTRWNLVTDVLVHCLLIERQDASGEYRPIWSGLAPLTWRHNRDALPKKIGPSAECDLCHLLNTPIALRLSPIIQGQMPAQFDEATKIRLTLQAKGVEMDSNTRQIEIIWDGKWTDDKEQINHHLVVPEEA